MRHSEPLISPSYLDRRYSAVTSDNVDTADDAANKQYNNPVQQQRPGSEKKKNEYNCDSSDDDSDDDDDVRHSEPLISPSYLDRRFRQQEEDDKQEHSAVTNDNVDIAADTNNIVVDTASRTVDDENQSLGTLPPLPDTMDLAYILEQIGKEQRKEE